MSSSGDWINPIPTTNPYDHRTLPIEVFYRLNRDGYINQIIDDTEPVDTSVHPTRHTPIYAPLPFTGLELAIKEFVYDNDVDKLAEYIINSVPRAQRRKLIKRLQDAL